jgi:TrmH RNA methyltransferase
MHAPRSGGARAPGSRGPQDTVKVHGRHACRAVFERRPDDVLRAFVTEEMAGPFGDVLDALARRRRPYKVVSPAELATITDSVHHEGVCLVTLPRPTAPLEEIARAAGPGLIVLLADVGNPHNVGAIIRTAAHFGARAVILAGGRERLPPAALRTSQGGAEWVDVVAAPDARAVDVALDLLQRAGFTIVATSCHAAEGRDLYAERLPERAVVMLGSEGEGLPRRLVERAHAQLRVPGTGRVESLNVAAAAAVILAELWRSGARRGRPPRPPLI